MSPKLSIILPTFNEAENIQPLIERIYSSFPKEKIEVIVADDDSPDETWKIAQKLQQKYTTLKVIQRTRNHGLAQSIQEGIDHSLGEYVAWMDADLSHPPELLPQMLSFLPKSDVVIASRYVPGASDSRKEISAVVLSKILNTVAYFLVSKKVTDYTSGFVIVKKEVLKEISFQKGYGEYFIYFVGKLIEKKVKIHEIPFINYSREKGSSKTFASLHQLLKNSVNYGLALLKIISRRND